MRPLVIIFSLICVVSIIPIPLHILNINIEGWLFIISLIFIDYKIIVKIPQKVYYLIFILVFYYLIGFIWNQVYHNIDLSFLTLIKSIYIIFLGINLNKVKEVKFILKSIFIAILVSSIFGFLIFLFGGSFALFRASLYPGFDDFIYYSKGMRVAGLSKTLFAFSYLVVFLPIYTLYKYFESRKLIYIGIFLFSVLIILLNGERSSLLFPAVSLLILLKKWTSNFYQIFIGLIILSVSIWMFNHSDLFNLKGNSINRLIDNSQENNQYRILKQYAAIVNIMEHPISGGTQYEYRQVMIRMVGWDPVSSAHNSYIRVAENVGILGIFIVFLFFKYLIEISRKTLNKYRNTEYEILSQVIIYSLLSVLLVGLFHNAGLFRGERVSIILISLLVSMYSMKSVSISNHRHKFYK